MVEIADMRSPMVPGRVHSSSRPAPRKFCRDLANDSMSARMLTHVGSVLQPAHRASYRLLGGYCTRFEIRPLRTAMRGQCSTDAECLATMDT